MLGKYVKVNNEHSPNFSVPVSSCRQTPMLTCCKILFVFCDDDLLSSRNTLSALTQGQGRD
jgi:hypothetical protein